MPGLSVLVCGPGVARTPASVLVLPPSVGRLRRTGAHGDGWALGTLTFERLLHEGGVQEDAEAVLAFEGLLLNAQTLQARWGATDLLGLAKATYSSIGEAFCREFRGEFCGAFLDKARNRWVLFSNQSGSKPLFVFRCEGCLAVSSSLPALAAMMKKAGLRYSLDEAAAYALLSHGYMLGNWTLLAEVRKIGAGESLVYEDGRGRVSSYHRFRNDSPMITEEGNAVDAIDEAFRRAASAAYSIDKRYARRPVCAVSGGLDCRMSAHGATLEGLGDALYVNYAQTGSRDERYPRRYCCDSGRELVFLPLDHGDYLRRTLDGMFDSNGGLITYAGASHMLSLCRRLQFEDLGLFHSGMLGDAVLGSYLKGKGHSDPKPGMGAMSSKMLSRIEVEEGVHVDGYANAEMYLLYNRGFNGIHNGTWAGNQFTVVHSPYLDPEFVATAFSISPRLRAGQDLRVDWICRRYPEVAGQKWADTGLSIRASRAFVKPLHLFKRALYRARPSLNMNPFEHWYSTNSRLREYFDDTYRTLAALWDGPTSLGKDADVLFRGGTVTEKAQVLTLLNAYREYFLQSWPGGCGGA